MRLLFFCLLICPASTPLYAQTLSEYVAYYRASTNGIGGEGERRLEAGEDGRYLLRNTLTAELLGQAVANLRQSVSLDIRDGAIKPIHYSYELSGVGSEVQTIDYDWAAGTARSREDDSRWELRLAPNTLDQLSHQLAMRLALEQGDAYANEYSFTLIDGGELEQHRYRFLGEEILNTAMGRLNTVKLERIREDSDRSTTIWLASDWEFLLARIEQRDGLMRIELDIRAAEMNGSSITPLP